MQNKDNAILTGCPILLQLWSYERIAIGRPLVDHSPYEQDMYGDTEDDRPHHGDSLVRSSGTEITAIRTILLSILLLCLTLFVFLIGILLISCRRVGPTYSLGSPILSL